ncbi:hypothetical protein QQG55_24820 [Brugia pahangi]
MFVKRKMMVDSMAFQLQIRATDSATLVYPKRKIYMYSTHGCYELGDIRSGSMSGDDSFLKFNCSYPQRYILKGNKEIALDDDKTI